MDHDDLPVGRILSRREALRVLGALSFLPLAGSAAGASAAGPARRTVGGVTGAPLGPNTLGLTPNQQMCVVRPAQTEGPYYVDHMLNRSDIRTNPPSAEITPGVPLDLTINVSRIAGDQCTPYAGAVVDVWQCDAAGIYSGVNDRNFNTVGKTWLRGFQTADANGQARFTTVYPGWYRGRTVHIHFKVRTSMEENAREFISQLYFDDAFTDRVFTRPPYAEYAGQRTRNEDDNIFRTTGGSQLILDVAAAGDGTRSTFNIGVQL